MSIATLSRAKLVRNQPAECPPVGSPLPASRGGVLVPAMILVLAVGLRLPGVARPLLGNFATKNVIYAMIARNFAEGRGPWLYPTLNVLVNDRPGYHLLELPLSAYMTGVAWKLVGGNLDVWGRAFSAAWSAVALVFLYRFVARWAGRSAATGALWIAAVSPIGMIYGQAFMLESSAVALGLVMLDSFDLWLRNGSRSRLALAIAAGAACFLTKIHMLHLAAPLVYLVWHHKGWRGLRQPVVWLVLAAMAALALAWCAHVYAATATGQALAERAYYSLRDSAETHRFPHPLLVSPGFYRGLVDDLSGVVLTPIGLALVLLGVWCCRRSQARGLVAVWLGAALCLVAVLPRKFAEMNYYWVLELPVLAAIGGVGLAQLGAWARPVGRGWLCAGVALWLALSLRYTATAAWVTPAEDAPVPAAGRMVQRLSTPGDRVIAAHGSSPALLYYCDRDGWNFPLEPVRTGDSPVKGTERELFADPVRRLAYLIEHGARWMVIVAPERLAHHAELAAAVGRHKEAARGAGFAIYDLRAEPAP